MKPFSLKAFKEGKPAITRDGKKAYFIAHNPDFIENQQVCFIVENEKEFFTCAENGEYFISSGIHQKDLVGMATVKRTVWVNLYEDDKNGYFYMTQERADSNCMSNRIGNRAWPLEIEE